MSNHPSRLDLPLSMPVLARIFRQHRQQRYTTLSFSSSKSIDTLRRPSMAQTKDEPAPAAPPPAATGQIPESDLLLLQRYLNLPETGMLPETTPTPLTFLRAYFDLVPTSLIHVFAEHTTPRERSRIPQVKARRMVWAGLGGAAGQRSTTGRGLPAELSAEEGWKRFPLLWERLGGDHLGPSTVQEANVVEHAVRPFEVPSQAAGGRNASGPSGGRSTRSRAGLFGAMDDDEDDIEPTMSKIPLGNPTRTPSASTSSSALPTAPPPPSAATTSTHPTSQRALDEAAWPSHSFMPGSDRASVLQVNRLGGLMRDLEEEREALDLVEARRRERRGQTAAEREEVVEPVVGDERDVIEAFERHLLELFLDGKDVRRLFIFCLCCHSRLRSSSCRQYHTTRSTLRNRQAETRSSSRTHRTITLTTRTSLITVRREGRDRRRSSWGMVNTITELCSASCVIGYSLKNTQVLACSALRYTSIHLAWMLVMAIRIHRLAVGTKQPCGDGRPLASRLASDRLGRLSIDLILRLDLIRSITQQAPAHVIMAQQIRAEDTIKSSISLDRSSSPRAESSPIAGFMASALLNRVNSGRLLIHPAISAVITCHLPCTQDDPPLPRYQAYGCIWLQRGTARVQPDTLHGRPPPSFAVFIGQGAYPKTNLPSCVVSVP
jgi:hypothetical protein